MIGIKDTRVIAIYEDIFDPTPKSVPLDSFDLIRLCDRVFPIICQTPDPRLRLGKCFSNAGTIAFELGFHTVFCFAIGPDRMVYPHAVVRNEKGVYYEISAGNDSAAQYYAYCSVSRNDYHDVLTSLGTNIADFLSGPRWFMSFNKQGDLLLPFTHKNRLDRPTVYGKDKFVVDISRSAREATILLRD